MSSSPQDLTVVIPTRDRWDILRRTIAALRSQTVQGFEVAVAVDGLDQAVPDDLDVNHVLVDAHAGPGAARNRAVAATERDLVLFLGDDMIPTPVLVEGHLDLHTAHPEPEVAVLGHVRWHRQAGGRRIRSWLDWSATQFDYVQLDGWAHRDVGFGRFYSSNVSVKRTLFERVGGFDPDFIFYYEDLDLGYRLGEAGLVLLYEPQAIAEHLHGYDFDQLRNRFAGIAVGERLMADTHPWFDPPYFHERIARAAAQPSVRPLWARLVDLVPAGSRARAALEWRADRWYLQQVADDFLAAWARAEHLLDLRRYLGEDFDASRLLRPASTAAATAAEASEEARLYGLTASALAGRTEPYLDEVRRHVPRGARLLDAGGGGADGLGLLDEGYHVDFAEVGPAGRYLRWRLERRGIDAPIHDLGRDELPAGYDGALVLDAIERLADPRDLLDRLERSARLVAVTVPDDDPGGGNDATGRRLTVGDLVGRARARGIVSQTVHDGGSQLLLYRGTPR
ncbi:MAG: glycosyltransferase [Actinobacteria bacterium]|nr:glycosyltransferase [Actinomycetota bacterium]